MAPGSAGNSYDAVRSLLDGLSRKSVANDIVQYGRTPRVRSVKHIAASAERSDDNRHLIFFTQCHKVIQPIVALVDYLIDGKRCSRLVGMGSVICRQRLSDF